LRNTVALLNQYFTNDNYPKMDPVGTKYRILAHSLLARIYGGSNANSKLIDHYFRVVPQTHTAEVILLVSLLDWTITNTQTTMETGQLKKLYDEICATLTPLGEFSMLVEVSVPPLLPSPSFSFWSDWFHSQILERGMKVYFGGDHFLQQYALVLISLERYEEAVVALNICMKENELAHYLASNILINYLGNVSP